MSVAVFASVLCGLLISVGLGPLLLLLTLISTLLLVAVRTQMVAAIALAPALLLPVDAFTSRAVGPLDLSVLLATWPLVVVAAVAAAGWRNRIAFPVGPAAPLLLIVLGGLLGSIRSGDGFAAEMVLGVGWLSAFLVGVYLVRTRKELEYVVLLVAAVACLSLYEAISGGNPYLMALPEMQFGAASQLGLHRSSGTFGAPIVAGGVFAICLCLGLGLWRRNLAVALGLIAAAALVTVSRSAVVAIVVGVLCLIVMRRGRGLRFGIAWALVGTLVVGLVLQLPLVRESAANRLSGKGRVDVVRTNGIEEFVRDAQHEPTGLLLGTGLRSTQDALQARGGNVGLSTLDNQYLTFAYDLGLIAWAGALAAMAYAVARAPNARRQLLLPALLGCVVVMLFYDALYWGSSAALTWCLYGTLTSGRDGEVWGDG